MQFKHQYVTKNYNQILSNSTYFTFQPYNHENRIKEINSDLIRPSLYDNITARKFIVDSVAYNPRTYESLPQHVQDDSAICLDIARKNPLAFRHFNYKHRDDDKIVRACLTTEPSKLNALFWSAVSGRLRQRKWIRDLAFAWSPYVFEHFTPTQKNEDSIGRKAFAHSTKLFSHLSEKLQNDWEIVLKYLGEEKKTLEELNVNGYSADLIKKIGTAYTPQASLGKLLAYGISKNVNPPLSNRIKL